MTATREDQVTHRVLLVCPADSRFCELPSFLSGKSYLVSTVHTAEDAVLLLDRPDVIPPSVVIVCFGLGISDEELVRVITHSRLDAGHVTRIGFIPERLAIHEDNLGCSYVYRNDRSAAMSAHLVGMACIAASI